MSQRVNFPTDIDPLDAIRAELVSAARRKVSARRRRKRALAATGIAVPAVAAATAGANALTGFSTGVPAVDRLLENVTERHQQTEAMTKDLPSGQAPPPMPDVRPASSEATPPIEVPWDEDRMAEAVAYVSREGVLCLAMAAPPGSGEKAIGSGNLGCSAPRLIASQLDERPAFIGGGGYGARTLVNGFARGDVESVRLLTKTGPVEGHLTEALTPPGSGGTPIRAFAATWEVDVGEDGLQHDEAQRISVDPPLEVTFADGRVERVVPR